MTLEIAAASSAVPLIKPLIFEPPRRGTGSPRSAVVALRGVCLVRADTLKWTFSATSPAVPHSAPIRSSFGPVAEGKAFPEINRGINDSAL